MTVPERVTFELGLMTYRCLHGQAPRHLADHVTSSSHRSRISTSATFRQPTPAHCASLSTQHVRSSGFSGRWNSLQPDELRDPACDVDSFKQYFKTILFSFY